MISLTLSIGFIGTDVIYDYVEPSIRLTSKLSPIFTLRRKLTNWHR